MLRRTTVRGRLTLLYGALFLVAGMALLAVNYVFAARALPAQKVAINYGELPPALVGDVKQWMAAQEAAVPASPNAEKKLAQALAGKPAAIDVVKKQAESVPVRAGLSQVSFEVKPSLVASLQKFPASVRAHELATLLRHSLDALIIMVFAAAALGWVVAGRVLRPLAAITGAARRLSGDNLHERLAFAGPDDELKELADTFDGMLGRLHAAFESQRRFVANASHELRTPLAIMRTELEVTLSDPATGEHELRRMAAVLSGAVDRSDQLIGHLLVLARSQRGLEELEPIDLADLVADAVGRHQTPAARAGLKVVTSLEPASLGGDRGLLEQLVTNLVDNAVKHNRPGGWIDVAVATIGSEVLLTVASSGFEVPPEAVDRLWEPFRRLTSDRLASPAGSGLGLSIVQAVANAHGGEAGAEPVEGGGLRVTVRLPAAPVLAALACPV